MVKKNLLYLGLIITLFCHSAISFAAKKTPVIKVRIADSKPQVVIAGLDMKRYLWTQKKSKQYRGNKTVAFNCKSKRNTRGYSKPIRLATLSSGTQILSFNNDKFKGKIHVQTSEKFNGCDVINEISIDDYLSTLLAKEMNPKWPIEALKAQAVAARSYAYYKIKTQQVSKTKGFETHYDIENSEYHQVNGSLYDATPKTNKAAKSTAGEVLTIDDKKLVPIFFHSKCGGKTRLPEQVWSNNVKGYTQVNCPFCHEHGVKNWENEISAKDMFGSIRKILRKQNYHIKKKDKFRFINDHLKASMIKFYVGDDLKSIKKSKIRSTLGRKRVPSNYFLLTNDRKKFKVMGAGYGHGVGMCQFGAKELALQGYTYKQILSHYFPEFDLTKVY